MNALVGEDIRLVHAVPGRVRVHLSGWSGWGQHHIEAQLRRAPGVRSAQVNPLTGNALIHFEPGTTDEQAILRAVQTLEPEAPDADG